MSKETRDVKTDQALPGLSLLWQAADGTALDLSTGWTATIEFTSPDDPTDLLRTWTASDGITLSNGSSGANFVVPEWLPLPWADLVTGWGKTLPAYGAPFYCDPVITRSADSAKYRWSDNHPRIVYWLSPAAS